MPREKFYRIILNFNEINFLERFKYSAGLSLPQKVIKHSINSTLVGLNIFSPSYFLCYVETFIGCVVTTA